MPIIDKNSKCCGCGQIPDMWCEISNVNGEKGFCAWYCFRHLREELESFSKIIKDHYEVKGKNE